MTVFSQCVECRHLQPGFRCDAFPEGIPWSILLNKHDHREPYPGDHGIRFKAKFKMVDGKLVDIPEDEDD
jgi:hypothetical protein